ncbi:uncharacterized protein LTR77_009808 [Saxophila tyrrhenica]|uniref:Uncharacterized protein n=1 Tax=Saxophila tyrrhenica TaxID=1690608 RepID=A0AAV9P0N8_9PEZI|nr:hypothetical protein LTR77_009808 [Saxophila tyrrhenica]
MAQLGWKRYGRLRQLAKDGNQDAIVLVQEGGVPSDLRGCRVLAAAGDEDAEQHLEAVQEQNRATRASHESSSSDDSDYVARLEELASKGNKDAIDILKRSHTPTFRAACVLFASLGDDTAIQYLAETQPNKREQHQENVAKRTAGDARAIATHKRAMERQRRKRAEEKKKVAAGDPDAIARRDRVLANARSWNARHGGAEYGKARTEERRRQRGIKFVEGFDWVSPERSESGEGQENSGEASPRSMETDSSTPGDTAQATKESYDIVNTNMHALDSIEPRSYTTEYTSQTIRIMAEKNCAKLEADLKFRAKELALELQKVNLELELVRLRREQMKDEQDAPMADVTEEGAGLA